jgi:hypothetical protein
MSWSASWTQKNQKIVAGPVLSNVTQVTEHLEQYQQCAEKVQAIIESGVLGDADAEFNVSLSGHGNPEHTPVAGWSNDFVGISIYQLGAPA